MRECSVPATTGAARATLVIVALEREGAWMAKTLVRPSLYEQDFLAWTEQQAALVRAGRLEQLDRDNLAEELDTMGRSESGELENRLEVLLMHMLKWDHQSARRSRSWKATMREQRNAIRRLMRRSPSLKRDLEATIAEVYRDAVGRASDETGLGAATFPEQLPYSLAEVLEPEPEATAAPAARRPGGRR
jgi:hypothetical protein